MLLDEYCQYQYTGFFPSIQQDWDKFQKGSHLAGTPCDVFLVLEGIEVVNE
jgi:hypothetical protein